MGLSNASKHNGNLLVFFNATIQAYFGAYFGMMHMSTLAHFFPYTCVCLQTKTGVCMGDFAAGLQVSLSWPD